MDLSKVSQGLLYSRHWGVFPYAFSFLSLHSSSFRWSHYPEHADDESGVLGVNYLALSPTATFETELLFESSPSKI